ncbi:MAG: hypothetical protein RR351_02950, partial [Christensenella sp.]
KCGAFRVKGACSLAGFGAAPRGLDLAGFGAAPRGLDLAGFGAEPQGLALAPGFTPAPTD